MPDSKIQQKFSIHQKYNIQQKLVAFNNILLHGSRPSFLFCGKSDVITNDLQDRPIFNLPAETLEKLFEIGFSWKKISKIVGVLRWTINKRVTKFQQQDISGFSSFLDSLILEYFDGHN